MSVFGLLVAREARLLFRRPAELANPLVFFAIVVSLFPLAVGPESQLLQTLSPGLVWVAALLSVLLSLDGLFRSDFEDGSLEQWVLSPHPLALLVLAARTRELRQLTGKFSAFCIQRGGIIHAISYSQACNFPRL